MPHDNPSDDGVPTFIPCSPGLAAVLVDVDNYGRQHNPVQWPIIGYEVRRRRWETDPRYFAMVLDRGGEAHPLNEILLHPDPVTGDKVECTGFISITGDQR